MAKKDDRTYGEGVKYIKCPNCKYEHPIGPDPKFPASYLNCARCGAEMPDMKKHVVEEEKKEEKIEEPVEAAAAPTTRTVFTKDGTEEQEIGS